jgi:hypothetical protein
VAIAVAWPTANAGSDSSAGPTPNTLPGLPVGVGPSRYQFIVTWYSSVRSTSWSSASDGRYA